MTDNEKFVVLLGELHQSLDRSNQLLCDLLEDLMANETNDIRNQRVKNELKRLRRTTK